MRCRDIIKQICDDNNINMAEMGRRLGLTRQNVWNMLIQEKTTKSGKVVDLNVETAVRMLDYLGYTLAVVPKSYQLNKNCYVIDGKMPEPADNGKSGEEGE